MNAMIPLLVLAAALLASPVNAQSKRGPGWEFGAHLLYLNSTDISFNGGSSISTSDEFGLSLSVGYRFSERLELHLDLDSQSVDYSTALQSETGRLLDGRGTLDAFSPRISATYNFTEGSITPYVTGGVGWSFIDTNIPKGPAYIDCYWDPWWGRVCAIEQNTRTLDEFTYKAGIGVRWDFSPGYTMRLAYEKAWVDFSQAASTPDFDQFKLGVVFLW